MTKETYNILNCFTGGVQFTAEIDCDPASPPPIKLGLAVRFAVAKRADLIDADLIGADLIGADLRGASLSCACLKGARLSCACLRGACLRGADLIGADLRGADLIGADLRGASLIGDKITRIVARATRSDDYEFIAFELEAGGVKILAGCRWFTLPEFRDHVGTYDELNDDYEGKTDETTAILDFIEVRARQLGVALEAPVLEAVLTHAPSASVVREGEDE